MAYEIGECSKCGWKGDIEKADQRAENEMLFLYCPNGCNEQVAPHRPLNASKDYFVNMFQRMFKEKKETYEYDPGEDSDNWMK